MKKSMAEIFSGSWDQAFSFDADARAAFSKLIEHGYVNGVMAGNALATHDLEGAYMNTALGQDIYTQETMENGHYNHLTTINRVRACGSIREFIEKEHIDNGIIYNCMKYNVPLVLAGSIRDDDAAGGVWKCIRSAGCDEKLCAQGNHSHLSCNDAAYDRNRKYDAVLPCASGWNGTRSVLLLRGYFRIHSQ